MSRSRFLPVPEIPHDAHVGWVDPVVVLELTDNPLLWPVLAIAELVIRIMVAEGNAPLQMSARGSISFRVLLDELTEGCPLWVHSRLNLRVARLIERLHVHLTWVLPLLDHDLAFFVGMDVPSRPDCLLDCREEVDQGFMYLITFNALFLAWLRMCRQDISAVDAFLPTKRTRGAVIAAVRSVQSRAADTRREASTGFEDLLAQYTLIMRLVIVQTLLYEELDTFVRESLVECTSLWTFHRRVSSYDCVSARYLMGQKWDKDLLIKVFFAHSSSAA